MTIRLFFILLVLCSPAISSAREYPKINITQNDGLPSNVIYDIYQDDEGYMWFATDKGVSRYNGVTFQNFTTEEGLPDNECFFFRKDLFGRLWIGTFNGGLVYYQNGIFHSAKNTPYLKLPFKGGNTADISIEKDSSITIFFRSTFYFINIIKNKIKIYNLKKLSEEYQKFLTDTSLMDVKYVNPNSFDIITSNSIINIDSNFHIKSLSKHNVKTISRCIVGRNQEYYLNNNAIYTKDFIKLADLPEEIINNRYIVNRIYLYNKKLFICVNNGLYVNHGFSFKNISTSTVFIDKDSNYWVSTLGNGVFKLDRNFLNSVIITEGYKSPVVFAQTVQDKLIISTQKRNSYIYSGDSCIFSYNYEQCFHVKPDAHSGNIIYNNYLLNFAGQNMYAMFTKDAIHTKINYCISAEVNSVFLSKNNIYLKGRNNLYTYNYIYKYINYINNEKWKKISIYGGSLDKDSTLWFSTMLHVYSIKDTTLIIQPQFGDIAYKEFCILKNYCLGYTFDNRLIIANNYYNQSISFDSSIKNTCVWDKFYKLSDSSVLVTTNDYYRIITLYRSNSKPKYTIKIIENQFIPQLADYFYTNGTDCYFFKNESIYQMPVGELFTKDAPPELKLTKLISADREYKVDSVVSLSFYESKNINIQYEVVSFGSNKIVYEYSLSSEQQANDKWINSNGNNISFLNMQYGTYIVKIRAQTYAGSYSACKVFKLIIRRPFWLTWWFLLIVLGVICSVILCIIRYLIAKKEHEKQKEIRFIKSEYRALNALMNPHFIFNSLNNVQGLINRNERQSASEYVRTISDLIRQNMYNISGDFISMEKEMDLVSNYLKLEKLRFKDLLNYDINIDPSVDIDLIMIPPLLIQPLVENALKYGLWQSSLKNGYIQINIYSEGNLVCIDVIDNGKGFAKFKENDTAHQSTALNNIKKRLEQLSVMHHKLIKFSIEEISDETGNAIGVKSSIKIY